MFGIKNQILFILSILLNNNAHLPKSRVDRSPIDIREKCLDVFRTISRDVIQDEGVFPNVHNQDWSESGDIAGFVQVDPMIPRTPMK